jgi:hypothetical protein
MYAYEAYPGNGATTQFTIPFPYIAQEHVEVYVDAVLKTLGSDYTFLNPSTISFTVAPANGATVGIQRNTPKDARIVDFQDASMLSEASLDQDSNQLLYITQEGYDVAEGSLKVAVDNTYDAETRRVSNLGAPVNPTDAVTKAYADVVVENAQAHASSSYGSAVAAAASAAAALISENNAAASEGAAALSEATAAGYAASINPASFQPVDAELTALAGLVSAADKVPYFTGSGTAGLKTLGTASGDIPVVGTSSATDAVAGLVELATSAEVITGTAASVAITPATLRGGAIVSGTAVASTSGTSIDFTSIPSWAKRITVVMRGVSLSGTSNLLIQLGTSGGVVASGYVSAEGHISGTTTNNLGAITNGFVAVTGGATGLISGKLTVELLSTNVYVGTAVFKAAPTIMGFLAGDVDLGGVLDRVRITSTNGTDTFDAGSVNIIYE